MSYTVLARRYRAGAFAGVIGQQTIATTLQNAIAAGRVAHAYLFTGTRGVGKTSMARILARALNAPATIDDCPKPDEADQYPDSQVQQRMAQAIMRGDDLNVIEIDGASNNSVEQARQLIANSGLMPTDQARYKIYIIDEVHMLSTSAFNALLKTMEEPPPHVKFILCTTESHKVPATIQSRCQCFDFRNISTTRISEHLKLVLKQEQIEAEDEVVWQLARLGNGSMRDALSLLDRLIAAGEQPLTGQILEQMLGLPPQQRIVQLVDALAQGDVGRVLSETSALLEGGIAQDQLIDELIERLRHLMLINSCGKDSELVELSDEARLIAADQAEQFDTPGLVHMIVLCDNLQRFAKASSTPRALLDVTMVRLALAEKMADVTTILATSASAGSSQRSQSLLAKKKELTPAPPKPPVAGAARTDSVNHDDAASVWRAVLESTVGKASLSWVAKLQLVYLDGASAKISAAPDHRDMLSFANQHRQRLVDLLRSALGRVVRVEIIDPKNAPPLDTSQDTPPEAPAERRTVDQQTAMSLPLVRQVMETFDATMLDAHPEL